MWIAGQAQGGRKQKKWDARLFVRNAETLAANKGSIRDRASYNDPLSYPPDVRHPPFLTLQGSLLPNHQKRNQDGDKRPYKKKLVHKTPPWCIGHTRSSSVFINSGRLRGERYGSTTMFRTAVLRCFHRSERGDLGISGGRVTAQSPSTLQPEAQPR